MKTRIQQFYKSYLAFEFSINGGDKPLCLVFELFVKSCLVKAGFLAGIIKGTFTCSLISKENAIEIKSIRGIGYKLIFNVKATEK